MIKSNLTPRSVLLAVSLVFGSVVPAVGQTCDAVLVRRAQEHFDNARFQEAKANVTPCLPSGFVRNVDREVALKIMALSLVAQDSTDLARFWVKQLVSRNTGYRADPQTDPPVFSMMVNEARPPAISWLWKGSRPIQWATRAALLGVAVVLPVVLWPEGPPAPLPGPPALPAN